MHLECLHQGICHKSVPVGTHPSQLFRWDVPSYFWDVPTFSLGRPNFFFGTSQAMCWDVPNVFWDTIDYMAWAFTDVSVSISISITVGSLVEPSHPSSSMTISLYYHSPRTVLLIPKGDTWYQSEEAGTASRSTRLTFGRRGLVGLASRIAAACFSRCLLKRVRRA